jgi:acetyl-CoA synthetase (ADP-forming)
MSSVNKTDKIIALASKENRKALLEPEAKAICNEYSISVPKFDVATNATEASEMAQKTGYPIVMKIVSPEIIHKSDAGGVKVNLKSKAEVAEAFKTIVANAKKYNAKADIKGVLVQEMAPNGIEVIIGAIKDAQFGQTVMFGLGGIFVEVLKDVTFRVAPITLDDAKEMITGLKAYPLLKGVRGQPPADTNAIAKILVNVSKLVMEHPEIKELDLNPIMAYAKGVATVDARIILE